MGVRRVLRRSSSEVNTGSWIMRTLSFIQLYLILHAASSSCSCRAAETTGDRSKASDCVAYNHTARDHADMTIYWRCGCGKVQLELSAEPWSVGNCHCHSCVASSRFLDEKYKDQENYASSIADGGSAGAFFMPNDVKVLTEELPPMGCSRLAKTARR
jgi:hypothetical protein